MIVSLVICAGFFSVVAAFGYVIAGVFFRSDWYLNMVAGGHRDAVASRRVINIFKGMVWLSFISQFVAFVLLLTTLVWLSRNDI
jgi:hypothetical protein